MVEIEEKGKEEMGSSGRRRENGDERRKYMREEGIRGVSCKLRERGVEERRRRKRRRRRRRRERGRKLERVS